jgi:hypothetical protein
MLLKSSFCRISLLLLSVFLITNCGNDSVKKAAVQEEADYVFRNVAILSMLEEGVSTAQDLWVKEGKIIKIGNGNGLKAKTEIDGKGKYLMPGLTEMHAHIPVARDGDDELVKETLFLYLSQGVTNIRGMLGNPYHLELKKQIASGAILGPRVYTSSPSMNGNSVKTVEEAKEKVTQYQKDGYDFLKIHPGIKLEVWDELERTAKAVGIPYAGHVPLEVGIRRALNAKYQTIDHLDGYLEGMVPTSANVNPSDNGFFGYGFTDLLDENTIEELVDLTIKNEVAVVSTQTLFTRWFSPTKAEIIGNEPEMKYMRPKTLFTWRQNKTQLIAGDGYNAQKWERFINIRTKLIQKLDEKGASFLLGSDAPQVFNVPGFSIHHELKAMKEAGLSNYKLLQSGTLQPAIFFGAKGKYGSIETGAASDLILLDANPLEDVSNAQKIAGVMVGKNWLSKSEIDEKLAEIASNNAKMSQ